MKSLIKFISRIEPDGLPYLWINGISFLWKESHWELAFKSSLV